MPDFAAELDVVRQTSPARVLADVADVPGVPPNVLNRINADPHAAVKRIAQTLQAYWDRALAADWPRLQALLETDVLWRSRRLAVGGARALFEDLDETVTWQGDRLCAADPYDYSGSPSGAGLLLVPSAMAWPTVRKMVEPYQPVLAYPARGIATLWETGPPPSSDALVALVGRTRAHLLTALAEPSTTTALAKRLALTPAISQHLSILHANGLVARSRVDASVLYRRTSRGDIFATTP